MSAAKKRLAVVLALAVSGFSAGAWLGARPRSAENQSPTAAPGPNLPPLSTLRLSSTQMRPASAVIAKRIAWERRLLKTPVEEYPALLEKAIRGDRCDASIHRLLYIWVERDMEGYIKYLGNRGTSVRRSRNYHISLESPLTLQLAGRDPEKAWDMAERLPGSAAMRQWGIVSILAAKDAISAAAFVRSHSDELSSAQQAYGWFQLDPLEMLPIVDALKDGSAKSSLVYELSRYYIDAENLDAAAAGKWFASLGEDLQKLIEVRINRREDALLPGQTRNLDALRRLWRVPARDAGAAK
jgi:hypothetical protein